MTLGDETKGPEVLALCGGIGGAKLALGLDRVLPPGRLTVVANVGDDFEHLGFHISPDIDTILYTLSGLADPERGWGRRDESWNFMTALAELGGETWFRLGDRDLALHVERTCALRAGETLSAFTARTAERLGIASAILPATDDALRTIVDTDEGPLAFQRYFVERQCAPAVRTVRFDSAGGARVNPALRRVLENGSPDAIVICPSNPFLSVDPILAVPGLRQMLVNDPAPIVAVSPIIGGKAVKGPTAKIMAELGIAATTAAIVAHYDGLLDGIVIDTEDADDADGLGIPVHVTPTLMTTLEERIQLAREVLSFAEQLQDGPVDDAR